MIGVHACGHVVDTIVCSTLLAYIPSTMLMCNNWLWVVVWVYRLISVWSPIQYSAGMVCVRCVRALHTLQ
jgi:hypothetical protein